MNEQNAEYLRLRQERDEAWAEYARAQWMYELHCLESPTCMLFVYPPEVGIRLDNRLK